MTYFGFLTIFLGIPILALAVLAFLDRCVGRQIVEARRGTPFLAALLLHILVAVLYTTPWDNYLVATGVWFYNPALVTGLRIGWVPVEEYTFFVLQTILTGLLLLALARRIRPDGQTLRGALWYRAIPALLLGGLWVIVAIRFALGWQTGTYLSLILLWALPPIILQFVFGGDVLWRERRYAGLALLLSTAYLSITDSLAIGSGTWTIAPELSLGVFLWGVLPLEEFIFFLVTNSLIVLGMTLLMAKESRLRLQDVVGKKVMEFS
jgi:lycopene cyclase domain-containing protein